MKFSSSSSITPPAKGHIRSLHALLHYIQPYRYYLAGMILALIITSSSVLSFGKGIAYLVDEGFSGNNPDLLNHALLTMLTITCVLAIATFARFFLITYVGERVIADIRHDVYSHIIHLPPSFFEHTKTGEILSRLTTDTTLLQEVVGSSLSIALRNSLLFVGGLALLFSTSLKLTLYALIIVPLVVLPIIVLGRKVRMLSKLSQDRVADITAHVEESVSFLRTVQAYAQEATEIAHFKSIVKQVLATAVRRISFRSLLTALVIIIVFSSITVVLWVGGNDVLSGKMTAGELSSFVFYAIVVAGALGALSEVVGSLQRAAGATERLFSLLHTHNSIKSPVNPKPLPANGQGIVLFDNVSFSYPSRPDKNALDAITLTTKPGETIAIVGPSGAGKTTFLQLLLRFYDVSAGKITLDGIDIRELAMNELRNQFALVPQEPSIFSGSARDNISYGKTEATDEEVIEAAKQANAWDFIHQLPNGLDTFLGEKGVKISTGQKQRIAIARAILKNPKILLLDEATSALDSENEALVQNALEKLMQNRTTFVIAHRLATVINADRILVINEGKIIESGTHNTLSQSSGLYAKLASKQFNL